MSKGEDHLVDLLFQQAQKAARFSYFDSPVIDTDDLVSIAIMGGLEALRTYDPGRGELSKHLYRRMTGAIKDAVRRYTGARLKYTGYRDRKAHRFSEMRLGDGDERAGFDIPANGPQPGHTTEVRDAIAHWRARQRISHREWLILMLRYGEGLSQAEVSRALGLDDSRISQIETPLRQRLGLPPLDKIGQPWRKREAG